MLANGFEKCQWKRSVLQSASFSRRRPQRCRAQQIHAALVSRQSFPHLWKNLWKIAQMNVWEQILARIETKVNRHSFYTWFRPTSFVAEDRSSIVVRVPNAVFMDWLTKHYSGVLAEAMAEVKRPNATVQFVPDSSGDAAAIPLNADEAAVLDSEPESAPIPGASGSARHAPELRLVDRAFGPGGIWS